MDNSLLRYEEQEIIIKIDGNVLNNYIINKLEVNSNVNNHMTLNLELEFTNTQIDKYISYNQVEDFFIEILASQKNNIDSKISIFCGICKESKIKYYGNQGYRFIALGYSKSHYMDRESKYRAFQDINMTYSEIINEILLDYSGNKNKIEIIESAKTKEKISSLIIQFDETDWEFIIRIISHLGLGVINNDKSVICIGFLDNEGEKKEDMKYTDYEYIRDGKDILYKIFSTQIFTPGTKISINNTIDENTFSIKNSKSVLLISSRNFT